METDLSLIWSSLGRISKHGLFPIPMDDISCRRSFLFLKAWRHNNLEISSVHASLISAVGAWKRKVSDGFRFRNQISNRNGLSPTCAVKPMSVVFKLCLYWNISKFWKQKKVQFSQDLLKKWIRALLRTVKTVHAYLFLWISPRFTKKD